MRITTHGMSRLSTARMYIVHVCCTAFACARYSVYLLWEHFHRQCSAFHIARLYKVSMRSSPNELISHSSDIDKSLIYYLNKMLTEIQEHFPLTHFSAYRGSGKGAQQTADRNGTWTDEIKCYRSIPRIGSSVSSLLIAVSNISPGHMKLVNSNKLPIRFSKACSSVE